MSYCHYVIAGVPAFVGAWLHFVVVDGGLTPPREKACGWSIWIGIARERQ